MPRATCPKPLLLAVLAVVATASVRPSSPAAIPPVKNARNTIQIASDSPAKAKPDSQQIGYFRAKVAPILEKCQPCHFKGGKMYAQLPFDDPKTIHRLGAQLFTRIKDRQEQAAIRAFLTPTADSLKTASGVSVPH